MANIKISALTAGTVLTGAEQLEAVQGGSSVRVTATQVKTYGDRQSLSYRAVANLFSETFAALQNVMILFNAGALASGTVIMPASPLDGDTARISFAMTVTALTVSPNAGQFLLGAPTTATVSTGYGFVYRSATTTWYRLA